MIEPIVPFAVSVPPATVIVPDPLKVPALRLLLPRASESEAPESARLASALAGVTFSVTAEPLLMVALSFAACPGYPVL
ncbi:MAG: hypothetical protein AB1700_04495, partial [Bacillota bacterium]